MPLIKLTKEILLNILYYCEVPDVLNVEKSRVSLFRNIINTKEHWLKQLRQLDQAHAPNLPLHVDPRSLSCNQLREMVMKAVQTYENCRRDPFGQGSTTISLDLAHLGLHNYFLPPILSPGPQLVPGGKHLFALWPQGLLHIIDIEKQTSVWSYPDHSTTDNCPAGPTWVEYYKVDFRADGSMAVLLCGHEKRHRRSRESEDIWIEVILISIEPFSSRTLFQRTFKDVEYLKIWSASIEGDFAVLYCVRQDSSFSDLSAFFIIDFVSDLILFSENYRAKLRQFDIAIIREHLFHSYYVVGKEECSSLIRVLDIRALFDRYAGCSRKSNIRKAIDFEELGFADFELKLPDAFKMSKIGPPSLCSFHWKEESQRYDQIMIQFSADYSDNSKIYKPVTNCYMFSPHKAQEGLPILRLVSSTGLVLKPTTSQNRRKILPSDCLWPPTLSGYSTHTVTFAGVQARLTQRPLKIVFLSVPDNGYKHGQHTESSSPLPERFQPAWAFTIDHLSNALLLPDAKKIKIIYPA